LVIERIFQFAETTPDAVAIYRHGGRLTYREFAGAISSARTEFINRQITGSGIVGVAIWDLQKFWICCLALRSLGLTALPVRSPEVLSDLLVPGLKYVVGPASWPGLEQICQSNRLCLIPVPSTTTISAILTRPELLDGGHILVTSGTTGRPKMVFWDSAAFDATFASNPEATAETVNHLFDYGPWTMAGFRRSSCVWLMGGSIIIHQGDDRYKAFQNLKGTHATILPNFLTEILAAPEGAFPFNRSMQLSVAGGTVTASQLKEARRRICPNIYNRLSATEVGSIAVTALEDAEDQRWHEVLPGVEVVDEAGAAVPPGQVGQLRVPIRSGPAEYLNDPEATARFFREGYFYPGDLAIARSDGRIALQGRSTEVVNVNGSKVAAGPFEDLMRERYKLSGVCLLSAQNERGEEQLYAVVETAESLPEGLHDRIEATFSDVQLQVVIVETLPRTSTGKVIRRDVQALLFAGGPNLEDDSRRSSARPIQ
jgi:acyl-CoA synthetase (AMP-forming)/AMP-acid ligase II